MSERDDRGRFVSESDRAYIHVEAEKIATALGIKRGLEKRIDALSDLRDLRVESGGAVPGLRDRIASLKVEHPQWFGSVAAQEIDWSKVPDGEFDATFARWMKERDAAFKAERAQRMGEPEKIDWSKVPEGEFRETFDAFLRREESSLL